MLEFLLAAALAVAPSTTASEASDSRTDREPTDDPVGDPGALFQAGRFMEAAAAFEAAYERTGDPALLFGRAQALRRAGNCNGAIGVLEQFIATSPPEADVAEARRVIEDCREVLGEDSTPEPAAPAPEPEPKRAPETRERPRWGKDVLGGALLGAGSFVAVAGVGVLAGSFAMAKDRDETEAEHEARAARVRRVSATGIVLLGVGGALLVASITRYAIVARRGRAVARAGPPLVWRF